MTPGSFGAAATGNGLRPRKSATQPGEDRRDRREAGRAQDHGRGAARAPAHVFEATEFSAVPQPRESRGVLQARKRAERGPDPRLFCAARGSSLSNLHPETYRSGRTERCGFCGSARVRAICSNTRNAAGGARTRKALAARVIAGCVYQFRHCRVQGVAGAGRTSSCPGYFRDAVPSVTMARRVMEARVACLRPPEPVVGGPGPALLLVRRAPAGFSSQDSALPVSKCPLRIGGSLVAEILAAPDADHLAVLAQKAVQRGLGGLLGVLDLGGLSSPGCSTQPRGRAHSRRLPAA